MMAGVYQCKESEILAGQVEPPRARRRDATHSELEVGDVVLLVRRHRQEQGLIVGGALQPMAAVHHDGLELRRDMDAVADVRLTFDLWPALPGGSRGPDRTCSCRPDRSHEGAATGRTALGRCLALVLSVPAPRSL